MKNNKKKKIITVFCVFAALLAVLLALCAILSGVLESVKNEDFSKTENIQNQAPARTTFYPADFEEDIMQDPLYLSQNRYIEYSSGGISVLVTDGDFSTLGEGAVFFGKYFDTVINGRYGEYSSFFTDEYLQAKSGYDTVAYDGSKFTMQKIFDIKVELLDEKEMVGAEEKTVERVFVVRYKILENNGTFRKDIGDDATYIPLVFETVTTGGQTKINKVYTYYI
jgi:hypothetical protein